MDIECANCGEPMYRDRYSRRVRSSDDLADRDAYYKWLCTNLCEPVLVSDDVIIDLSEEDDDDWEDDDDEDYCSCCS